METSQLLPPSMLGDSALLTTIDGVDAALSTLLTYRLQVTADLDHRGLAKVIGAHDTVEFLALRHHRNPRDVRRDLKTGKALPKYTAVTAALPDPQTPTDTSFDDADPTDVDASADADSHADADAQVDGDGDGSGGGVQGVVVLNPGQAEAIVSTLEKAPPTVSDEELRVAEEQMIEAARLLSPDGLVEFGREVLNRLDTDGPEPAEDDAHANETLSLRRADGGVRINGYLTGENAELFRTQINRLSKPHRTVDGDLDPRSHAKRQADALTTILNAAAATMPRKRTPSTPGTPGESAEPGESTGPGGGDPHQEHPGRFFAPPSPRAKPQAGTGGLSWLTPEAVALLDPWGGSSTPSAGP
ncbi:DUF222 domain-containing protein [Kribbella catacumbae]|uniref:DUF222 domain-containing protein n=1 Tax=Kribbella catacumbae TaxID=460086 RepID=UPI0003A44533|nr:DUF222 domain-containing protein [Kribbella catacumbae]